MAKLLKSVWFRCITTLLVIILFSGVSISILSDVLYVSPQERTDRGIVKVYGSLVKYDTVFDIDNEKFNDDTLTEEQKSLIIYQTGRINKIYTVGDTSSNSYEYLFQSIGYNGFKNGTVTVWVKVLYTSGTYSITQVLLESNKNQSLINNLGGDYYSNFELQDVTLSWKNGEFFTANKSDKNSINYNPVSGATYSANAGNNAVNCVINYIGGAFANEN
ncbi:MAG: hypothetical protein J6C62_06610 [Clostridia bacterium]|nr:hypothetical protein [Clostridia bacterium]